MKKRTLLLSIPVLCIFVALVFFISSCNKKIESAKTDNDLRSALKQDMQQEFDGRAILRVTSNREVLITLSSADNGVIDHFFMLMVDPKDPIDIKDGDLGLSSVFFYKDQRAIALHSKTTNEVYFFGLNEDASRSKIDSLSLNEDLKAIPKTNVLGYGLSSVKGQFDKNILINTTKKYASSLIVLADLQNKYTTDQKTMATNDDIGINCFSGGPNSTGCSWTAPVVGSSCSVTCAAGSYACCNAVTCKCFLNGTQPTLGGSPKYGQCGGEGWAGPTYCAAGSTCTYVNQFYSQCL